ncbi:MAG: hypothetical protein ACI80K_003949, partial [Paracoccaceae bacterium]
MCSRDQRFESTAFTHHLTMIKLLQGLAAAALIFGMSAAPTMAQDCATSAAKTCSSQDVKAKATTVAKKADAGSCCATKAKAATVAAKSADKTSCGSTCPTTKAQVVAKKVDAECCATEAKAATVAAKADGACCSSAATKATTVSVKADGECCATSAKAATVAVKKEGECC